ncbi:MAG: transposase [Spiroplasma poulsonii]|uniref:Transposase n=1 Tax=Spiroplasma poulsonii TaxID=2138 RepID=A0A3S0TYF2_9MOLU|nr:MULTISPECIES: helix-turn-helix domain-containing protein [Spiroplasma]MBH8623284.1 hypothetical protein [Spiroplasma sp. hyd1]MBW1241709.1 transposase [Spiroplasma poulsonii]MBW3058364.1 hypothetical protein [Spiroplasma poulsonii]RUP77529.1 transposase [Spiroplasma poulsonii]
MAKNHYTDEFKQQIVSLYKTGKTAKQLSSDYQVGKSTVWKWIHEFNNSGSFKAKDNRSPKENEKNSRTNCKRTTNICIDYSIW